MHALFHPCLIALQPSESFRSVTVPTQYVKWTRLAKRRTIESFHKIRTKKEQNGILSHTVASLN